MLSIKTQEAMLVINAVKYLADEGIIKVPRIHLPALEQWLHETKSTVLEDKPKKESK